MAGFQQAANAIVGAPGQIMRSTGIYNELVGKNEELIKELGSTNDELEKKNQALDKKNKKINENNKTIKSQYKELEKKNEELELTNSNLISSLKLNLKQNELAQDFAKRIYDHQRAQESKKDMLKKLYGKPTEEEEAPEEIPFFKKRG